MFNCSRLLSNVSSVDIASTGASIPEINLIYVGEAFFLCNSDTHLELSYFEILKKTSLPGKSPLSFIETAGTGKQVHEDATYRILATIFSSKIGVSTLLVA